MDALLRRRMIIMSSGGDTPIQTNYLVYGSPTISGTSYIPDKSAKGFLYTNIPFSPGLETSWTIQTKFKINNAVAWRDIISSVNSSGESVRAIVSQFANSNSNRQTRIYLSNNGSSWNLSNGGCTVTYSSNNTWYIFQLVCSYSNGNYVFKQGFPEIDTWSSNLSKTTPPTYDNYIAFGGGFAAASPDSEFDLSETKIIVNGSVVWEAITTI